MGVSVETLVPSSTVGNMGNSHLFRDPHRPVERYGGKYLVCHQTKTSAEVPSSETRIAYRYHHEFIPPSHETAGGGTSHRRTLHGKPAWNVSYPILNSNIEIGR